jgi:Spy/CpxP family protein refolding chaperone
VLTTKKVAALIAALALAGATAPMASATPPKNQCNSGNGNHSETDPSNDCDPGNSGGHNNGGD